MLNVEFYGGVNEIGGNRILVEASMRRSRQEIDVYGKR